MKKEFYKLTFVFIMIVFSFSLAFFLGREMALSPSQPAQKKISKNSLLQNPSAHNPPPTHAEQTQREKVELYKKTLSDQPALKKPQTGTIIPKDIKESAQLRGRDFSATLKKNNLNLKSSIGALKQPNQGKSAEHPLKAKNPSIKKEKTNNQNKQPEEKNLLYALLVAQHDNKKSAVENSTKLKSRFPHWKIFFKKSKDSYKVYIGPFSPKEPAEKFLKEIQEKPDFSKVKLEQLN